MVSGHNSATNFGEHILLLVQRRLDFVEAAIGHGLQETGRCAASSWLEYRLRYKSSYLGTKVTRPTDLCWLRNIR